MREPNEIDYDRLDRVVNALFRATAAGLLTWVLMLSIGAVMGWL